MQNCFEKCLLNKFLSFIRKRKSFVKKQITCILWWCHNQTDDVIKRIFLLLNCIYKIRFIHYVLFNNRSVAFSILQNFNVFVPILLVITSKLSLISAFMQAPLSALIASPVFKSKVFINASVTFFWFLRDTCIAHETCRFWIEEPPLSRFPDRCCVRWVSSDEFLQFLVSCSVDLHLQQYVRRKRLFRPFRDVDAFLGQFTGLWRCHRVVAFRVVAFWAPLMQTKFLTSA